MTFLHYKPEVWAAEFLVQLRKNLIYAGPQIVNHDYEGSIQQAGDTVHITAMGDVTVSDYDEDTDLDYEDVPDAGLTLVIDQQKAYAVAVKDIDKAQALDGGRAVAQIMSQAAYRMSDAADQFVAAKYTDIAAANVLDGSDYTMSTAGKAYELLVDMGVLLDENDVPTEGRYTTVPPWFHGILRKDPNFINAEKSGSTAPLLNGQVGEAAGFAILKSNNNPSPSAGENVIQAGTPMAISFANQLVESEALRDQKRFRDLLRGLHVYGGKVTYPNGLACATVTRPS